MVAQNATWPNFYYLLLFNLCRLQLAHSPVGKNTFLFLATPSDSLRPLQLGISDCHDSKKLIWIYHNYLRCLIIPQPKPCPNRDRYKLPILNGLGFSHPMPKNILRSACFKRSSCHRCGVSRNNSVWKEGSRDLLKHPWYPCPNGILVLMDSPMILGSQTWSDKVGAELDWQQMAQIYHGTWHIYSPETNMTMEHHRV